MASGIIAGHGPRRAGERAKHHGEPGLGGIGCSALSGLRALRAASRSAAGESTCNDGITLHRLLPLP